MKTPDVIKKGLNCNNIDHCNECPYDGLDCAKHVDQDALAYIQQLEGDLAEERELNEFLCDKVKQLESRLAQVERERDALIKHVQGKCHACKHADGFPNEGLCGSCKHTFHAKRESAENWEWRGVCEENKKEEK